MDATYLGPREVAKGAKEEGVDEDRVKECEADIVDEESDNGS